MTSQPVNGVLALALVWGFILAVMAANWLIDAMAWAFGR